MVTTRGIDSAKPALCVTTTMVVPCFWLISKKSSCIAALVAESRLPVGSSARRSFGESTSARASATRCCSPPESSPGRWVTRSRQAHLGEERARRASISRCALALDEARHHHVLERVELGQQVVELEDEADGAVADRRELARRRGR